MFAITPRSALVPPVLLFTLAAAVSGCAHVKPEQLDAEISGLRQQLRGEMAAGDERLADELGTLSGRVDDLETRMTTLERELSQLAEEMDGTVERLEAALRFNMPLYFGFDEDTLTPQHMEMLDRFAAVVREFYPGAVITAEGFTDPAGSQEYNQALGLRRAEAVRAYLGNHGGLGPENVKAVSYGEASPRQITPGSHGPGTQGWENRRVAFVIDHSGA